MRQDVIFIAKIKIIYMPFKGRAMTMGARTWAKRLLMMMSFQSHSPNEIRTLIISRAWR